MSYHRFSCCHRLAITALRPTYIFFVVVWILLPGALLDEPKDPPLKEEKALIPWEKNGSENPENPPIDPSPPKLPKPPLPPLPPAFLPKILEKKSFSELSWPKSQKKCLKMSLALDQLKLELYEEVPLWPYLSYFFLFSPSLRTSQASLTSLNFSEASSLLSGFLSGCHFIASFRYPFLTSSSEHVFWRSRTSQQQRLDSFILLLFKPLGCLLRRPLEFSRKGCFQRTRQCGQFHQGHILGVLLFH